MITTNTATVRTDQVRYIALDGPRHIVLVAFIGSNETLAIKFHTYEDALARYEALARAMDTPCPTPPTPS